MKNKKKTKAPDATNVQNGRALENDNLVPGVGTPGITTPGIELPAFNPPIPNRAWTAMRKGDGNGIDVMSDEEKANLYFGKDNFT